MIYTFNSSRAEFIFGNGKKIFAFAIIYQPWNDIGSWNPSGLRGIVDIMVSGYLATKEPGY